jgi:hypothetical protein
VTVSQREEQKSIAATQPIRIVRICNPEEAKHIATVCHPLDMALEHLDTACTSLKARAVFTDDVILPTSS